MNTLKLANFFFQRVLGINKSAGFLVHFTSQVYDGQNITAHPTVHKYLWSAGGCFYHGMNGIEIGEGTIISAGVKIVSASHEEYDYKVLVRDPGYRIVIGKRCWLGSNSVLLPGVKLGDDVIVGAGAVVTKDFPSGSVVAGVPAKKIREKCHAKSNPSAS